MAEVVLRPDLKTAGGEANDIVVNGRFAGTLVLVYREGERLSGAVQLETDHLDAREAEQVNRFVDCYVRDLAGAIGVEDYEAVVTLGSCHHILSADSWQRETDDPEQLYEDEPEVIWVSDDEDALGDWDFYEPETVLMDEAEMGYADEEDDGETGFYELIPTRTGANHSEYHVYDEGGEWAAELIIRQTGGGLVADVHWMFQPETEEMDALADHIADELEERVSDGFRLNHRYEGTILETADYAQEDIGDSADYVDNGSFAAGQSEDQDYRVILARDDQDMLTYEIYDRFRAYPMGTATVDISRRQLSGFIDFRDSSVQPGDRERIAALIMHELDKEKDYSRISFTMLARNKPIDEVIFENEPFH
ncbi:hypothetical protein [Paenibacillus sp. YN15]|uniref:hypothetical protein n=1 Tax=Paenibacillus sp. YN15 TaxID=1742774 RepID=UPI000DCB4BD1|nr:hypothetical protein [Paenibacillus sp. YN15]RAU99891.1 hypothetical protein DQG13_15460 [Paenibacillus sp. YN15]